MDIHDASKIVTKNEAMVDESYFMSGNSPLEFVKEFVDNVSSNTKYHYTLDLAISINDLLSNLNMVGVY